MENTNLIENFYPKSRVSLHDLKIDVVYPIYDLRGMRTPLGRVIIAELEEQIVVLPKQYSSFTDNTLELMCFSRMCLMYKGVKEIEQNQNEDVLRFFKM